MSIAASAVIRPSRIHRILLGGAGLALFAAAFAVGLSASARFHACFLQAAILAGAGAVLMHAGLESAKTHRIDIFGTGEMVLTVQQGLRMLGAGAADGAATRTSWRFGGCVMKNIPAPAAITNTAAAAH